MAHSVPHLFFHNVDTLSNRIACSEKIDGEWISHTWQSLQKDTRKISASLQAIGVKPGERVAIISNSQLKWTLSDLAISCVGGVTVPIYQSTLPNDCAYILNDAQVSVVFVENAEQEEKISKIKGQVTTLRDVVSFEADHWEQFLQKGEELLAQGGNPFAAVDNVLESDLATIVYTSGTTGHPKGAMLTHGNLLYEAQAIEKLGLLSEDDTQLLFLPLAHIFAKILQIAWLKTGHKLAYAESIEKVVDNMAEVQPTIMAAVPRIYEKVHAKVVSNAISGSLVKSKLAKWAFNEEALATKYEINGNPSQSLAWLIAQKLVFSKISDYLKEKFGGKLRFFISGGAPLSEEINYFFKHAGITICEGYGLTETSAATCINIPSQFKMGTVGKPLPGTEIKIASDGEILIRGKGVFKGYWNREEATKKVLNEEGWFHSGDIGQLTDQGFLKITDRKKDIIVTAGGKNVAPQKIENLLKSMCSLVSQVVVHGDKRKYLTALITLDEAALLPWAKARKLKGDYEKLCEHERVNFLLKHILGKMKDKLASHEQIKKFKVLSKDFCIGEELTPTLKVKRSFCNEKYTSELEGMYS